MSKAYLCHHFFLTGYATIPSITYCKQSLEEICLEVDFHDRGRNERAFLNRIDNCVFYGSFQGSNAGVAIAASTDNCPMTNTSMMQVNSSGPSSEKHAH